MSRCLADPAYHFIYKCVLLQQTKYSRAIFELRKAQMEREEGWDGSLPIRWGDVKLEDERVFKVSTGFVDGEGEDGIALRKEQSEATS